MLFICCNSCIESCRNRKEHSERTTKTKTFINKSIWEGINFHSEKDDWKKRRKIF